MDENETAKEVDAAIAIVCRGVRFDEGFRADIIVEGEVIVISFPRRSVGTRERDLSYKPIGKRVASLV